MVEESTFFFNDYALQISENQRLRLYFALLIPLLAACLQWLLWPFLPPLTWILFYPAIFLSAWIGRFTGGILSTLFSAVLGIYFFIPDQFSWSITDQRYIHSIYIFVGMGILFSLFQERYHSVLENLNKLNQNLGKDSNASLQLALESANAGFWEWNLKTNRIEWSDTLWGLFGLESHTCEPSYEAWLNIIHPDDKEMAAGVINKAAQSGSEIFMEWRVINNGKIRWLMSKGRPEFNKKVKPVLYRGFVIDISERKRIEWESQCWANAFQHCAYGIAIGDPLKNCILYCNPAYAHMLGFNNPQEIEGVSILQLYTPDQRERVQIYIEEADKLGKIQYESIYQRKDKTTFDVQVDLACVKDANNRLLYRVATVQDISERQKLGSLIIEKERLLSESQAIAHVGSWMLDLKTNCLIWSDEHLRLFDLTPGTDSTPTFEKFISLLHPIDRPAMKQWIEACLAGKNPPGLEFRRLDEGGNFRWLYGRGQLERDEHGNSFRMFGTTQDITDRKKMEEERLYIETRYRALVDQAAPDALYVHDHQGNFIEVNQKACEYDGYSKEEFLKLNVLDVEKDFDLTTLQQAWSAIQPGITSTLYGQHRRKDGSTFPVEVRFGLLEYSGQRLYIALVRDITERMKAEEQLLLQSKVLEAAGNAILIADPKGLIEWVNPAFTRLTGFTKEEAIGSTMDKLVSCTICPPDAHQEVWGIINKGQIWHGEIICQRKDGADYTEEQTITPVMDEKGIIRHYIAIKQDITSRKQNEAELERYQNDLERLVDDRTRELNIARKEAERLSQVKSAFLANMSHEIRSPMNAMMGFFYLLEQQPLEGEAHELVHKARFAGQSLLAIINDILDFSKIESGHLEIERFPFRLSDMLDQIAALMSAMAGDKNLELIINPSAIFVDHMNGDGLRLQQVLVNLCSNAIKFTEKGEVELTIKLLKVLKGNKVKMHFAVRDTGIGISEEKQNEIFNAFSQADISITRRFGGSGLGLAISRQLVSLMGGTLQVESKLGKGSVFWFDLVLERDKSIDNTPKELNYLKLLVADDCATARTAIVSIANALGWVAESVGSGEAACSHVMQRSESNDSYDVILLDWRMPGMDGLATAKAIKKSLDSGNAKKELAPIVIMVSADSRDELMESNGIEYIDFILSKPVTLSSLYNAILSTAKKSHPKTDNLSNKSPGNSKNDLAGIKVLVVDDSDVNCEIAKSILTLHNAWVNIAKDGQEALAWLEKNPDGVDIILMDIQMPGMDGYETTNRIRQDSRWRKLPIVALTAGAFTADLETARIAGMDEFITKPFSVDRLVSVIQHIVSSISGKNDTCVVSEKMSDSPITLQTLNTGNYDLSLPSIDVEEGIKRFGDKYAYLTYLAKFMNSYAKSGDEIARYILSGNISGASALAHKLKGAAGNLALKHIYHYAYKIEACLISGSEIMNTDKYLQNAIDEAGKIITCLRQAETETTQASDKADVHDVVELITLLEPFLLALNKDNPAAVEPLLLQLKLKLPAADYVLLKEKIENFDFQTAKTITVELINKLRSDCV